MSSVRDHERRQAVRLEEQHEDEHRRDQDLKHELLSGRQACVLLLLDLCVVVHQTDRAVGRRQAEDGQRVNRQRAGNEAAEDDGERDADDEHETAHRRDVLFVHMPLRSDLKNFLTEFHLAQIADDRRADGGRDHKRDRAADKCLLHLFNFLP